MNLCTINKVIQANFIGYIRGLLDPRVFKLVKTLTVTRSTVILTYFIELSTNINGIESFWLFTKRPLT